MKTSPPESLPFGLSFRRRGRYRLWIPLFHLTRCQPRSAVQLRTPRYTKDRILQLLQALASLDLKLVRCLDCLLYTSAHGILILRNSSRSLGHQVYGRLSATLPYNHVPPAIPSHSADWRRYIASKGLRLIVHLGLAPQTGEYFGRLRHQTKPMGQAGV